MPQYLAIYTGTPNTRAVSGWDAMTEAEQAARQAEGVAAWNAWMQTHHQHIVLPGGPLGATKKVSMAGIEDASNEMVGFVVLEAESHAAAAALFEAHPHFSIFPGDGVEIMECLPTPDA